MNAQRILIVDDEPSVLSAIRRDLRMRKQAPFPELVIDVTSDANAALSMVQETPYAVVISDYRMPQIDGVQVLEATRRAQPDAGRILLSGQIDMASLQAAINDAQIHMYLTKPWRNDDVAEAVAGLAEQHREALDKAERIDGIERDAGVLSPQEAELRRLERLEPGITQVEWTPDGAVVITR